MCACVQSFFADGTDADALPARLLLSGPPRSGKSSLLLQLAYNRAARGEATLYVCASRELVEGRPPVRPREAAAASASASDDEARLRLIQIKYVSTAEQLRDLLCGFHLAAPAPASSAGGGSAAGTHASEAASPARPSPPISALLIDDLREIVLSPSASPHKRLRDSPGDSPGVATPVGASPRRWQGGAPLMHLSSAVCLAAHAADYLDAQLAKAAPAGGAVSAAGAEAGGEAGGGAGETEGSGAWRGIEQKRCLLVVALGGGPGGGLPTAAEATLFGRWLHAEARPPLARLWQAAPGLSLAAPPGGRAGGALPRVTRPSPAAAARRPASRPTTRTRVGRASPSPPSPSPRWRCRSGAPLRSSSTPRPRLISLLPRAARRRTAPPSPRQARPRGQSATATSGACRCTGPSRRRSRRAAPPRIRRAGLTNSPRAGSASSRPPAESES